jgi:hypothetical protein
MLGFFDKKTLSGVNGVLSNVTTKVANVKSALSDKLSDKLSIAKTKFDATGVSGTFANAKSVLSDVLSEALKPKSIADIAKTQIKEIEGFLTTETETKLNAFIENHKKVADVIKAFNVNIKSLTGDTNRRIECSYYETYEDIGINKITTASLTLSEAEEKRTFQKTYCDKLFQDNATELSFISSNTSSIGKNIIALLQKISENRNDTELVNKLTLLRSKLQKYKDILYKYIIPFKCGENGIKGLFPSKIRVGGGSYKKTNKKNILGKERCIYKKSGDRKEYIKYKGNFIAVREYKKLLKTR